ncbi:MAG: 4-(cytidine 5'-diphospho)-2-C-methyl-D-erythritol kinase [Clostridiales bacterium]|nr:4-(cytidine 5'-diphospho)-2-C-methyl-D-erythritol kinase [Clostridiales bacterium]
MPTESYEITANAKINLFLRVKGTLPNGYHSLYTVMQEIACADQITVNIDDTRTGFKINCIGRSDIDPKKNLCRKACDRFYSNMKKIRDGFVPPYTEIELIKNIPSESGMGGGSSDAAAILLVLQEHFGNPFEEEQLLKIAVNVGADVPFFLYGGTALCEKVGEDVTPIGTLAGLGVLIAKPNAGVSTPECFALIDKEPAKPFDVDAYAKYIEGLKAPSKSASEILEKIVAGGDLLVNDLESPASKLIPEISDIRTALENLGSAYCRMTGSGSAVFALFENLADAALAKERAKKDAVLSKCNLILAETV